MTFEIPVVGSDKNIVVDADAYEAASKMRWRMITHTHGARVTSCSKPSIPLTRIIFGTDGGRIIRRSGELHDYRRQHFQVYDKDGKAVKCNPRPVYKTQTAAQKAKERWLKLSVKPKTKQEVSERRLWRVRQRVQSDVATALQKYGIPQPQQLNCQSRVLEVG